MLFGLAASVFAATSWEYYQAGMRLYNRQDYTQAERYFQAAIAEDPGNWQAYQGLGLCQYAQGDRASAKQAFDQSLQIHPDNAQLAKFDESLGAGPAVSSNNGGGAGSSVTGGGNFGLGLMFGGPGTWGATGKYWMDEKNAFQGFVQIGGGTVLGLQYLWHDYDLIHPGQGAFPFYIGLGGDLALGGGGAAVAGCVPIGLDYLFRRKSLPLDIFVEVVPTLWIGGGGIDLVLYGDVGSRFYF